MRAAPAILLLALWGTAAVGTPPLAAQTARTLRVGPGEAHATISAALAVASAGDTVSVAPGVYRENLVVETPVVLRGRGRPVIDGGGAGHVVEASAPVEVRGFEIRASGRRVDTEDAGVMVRAGPSRIVDNRLEDVFYGIYLKDAPGSTVRGNVIRGKDLPRPRRGDGIRLWYSSGSRILGNDVSGTRDVVVYFSDSLLVADNEITRGRYGLHYMYSDDNRFLRNRFTGNEVGAFIMYSKRIRLRENVFADAHGASGMGLGLKDADDIRVEDNLFVENASGIYLDNSPTGRDARNRFEGNLVLYNGSGVRLLPSVRDNTFTGNAFVGNRVPGQISGGARAGVADQNRFHGNRWSGYAGFDRDGDGVGDTPYVHARLSDDLLAGHPTLRLFALSPSLQVVDALSRFFPLLRPQPVVVDSAPAVDRDLVDRWTSSPPVPPARAGSGADGDGPLSGRAAAALWAGVALLSAGALRRGSRA